MAYIGKSPTGTGVRSRYYFTAAGGETSLSGADDSGATLSFTDGAYVDVSLNGIALVAGTDYNTSTANTIGGLSALSASDIVEVVVYDIFTVADTVSAKDGGTFSGNVAMGGTLSVTGASTATGGLNVGTIKEATGTTTAMTIDSSGRVLMPQKPLLVAKLTTSNDQDAVNPYTFGAVDIHWDSVVINQGNCYSSSTGVFTCPVDGIYNVSFMYITNNDLASQVASGIYKEGVLQTQGYSYAHSTAHEAVSASIDLDCVATDEISVRLIIGNIYIDASGSHNNFCVKLVG